LRGNFEGADVIRELPRGPFDSYLRAHYFNDKPSVLPRFSMGCGAIFMIQRVRSLDASLSAQDAIVETDPGLLEEMIALVVAQGLEVVSLAEMRRRLVERELGKRFVSFTFDGAYRSVVDKVLPLFEARALPFTVYAAADYLEGPRVPWWISLEALFRDCDRVSLEIEGTPLDMRCRSPIEKQNAYSSLFARLKTFEPETRAALLETALKAHGIDRDALAAREMLSAEDLRSLAENSLITVGVLGGGLKALATLSFDDARQELEQSLQTLEAGLGRRPSHLSLPAHGKRVSTQRDVEIAATLGFDTAVTAIEGALWPEHARELLALPRIALDNDPATLVRALMLSGAGQATASGTPVLRKAAG
jgi:peptidoglycan/xylan/chitin deacetylase (PgdA/CDA1 family)